MKFRKSACWWVEDGNNWCKTKWWYVITGKHRGQKLKFAEK